MYIRVAKVVVHQEKLLSYYIYSSDEFELRFPELSRAKKVPSRAKPSWALQFLS